MSAVVDRLDLATVDKSELDVVREYLRVQLSEEGTLAESEFIGMGDGLNPIFALDHFPVLAGTLRLLVGGVLLTEGGAANYTIVLATGAVTFNAGSIPGVAAPVTGSYYHGTDPVGADDTTLAMLLISAKASADEYLNNAFESVNPTITVTEPVIGDGVSIDGMTFMAAAATDVTAHEFAIGGDDAATGDALCLCINNAVLDGDDGAYGVAGVKATNVAGVVTLTKRWPRVTKIEASSAQESLLVTYLRTEDAIPDPVGIWVLQRVGHLYENRQEGLTSGAVSGLGSQNWATQDMSQLAPFRRFAET